MGTSPFERKVDRRVPTFFYCFFSLPHCHTRMSADGGTKPAGRSVELAPLTLQGTDVGTQSCPEGSGFSHREPRWSAQSCPLPRMPPAPSCTWESPPWCFQLSVASSGKPSLTPPACVRFLLLWALSEHWIWPLLTISSFCSSGVGGCLCTCTPVHKYVCSHIHTHVHTYTHAPPMSVTQGQKQQPHHL